MITAPSVRTRTTYVADALKAIESGLAAGDFPAARAAAQRAAEAAPHDPHVLYSCGVLCELADQPQQALEQWLHAVTIDATAAAPWSAIGTLLSRGQPVHLPHLVALLAFSQATKADPVWISPAWFLAMLYHALGYTESAQSALKRVQHIMLQHADKPQNLGSANVHNRAYMHLTLGHLEVGFACYEERLNDMGHMLNERAATRPPEGVPRWTDPTQLPERLAIFVEQGAGDMLMCLRYARWLADCDVDVQLEVFPSMYDYVRDRLSWHDHITVIPQDAPLERAVDAYVWAMSLPGLLREHTEIEGTVRLSRGSIASSPERTRYVGFCWQGSRSHKSDMIRSCPVETFRPIAEQVRALGYIPFALNPGEPIPEWLANIGEPTSFLETAQMLELCAAVVSVDTALVHLAGCEDVPAFACLSALPDWRWGLHSTATRWYPSVTLVRQPTIGDWQSVVDQIIPQLTALLTPSDTPNE